MEENQENTIESVESYNLGYLTGKIVILESIPSLEVDDIRTNNIVNLTSADRVRYKEIIREIEDLESNQSPDVVLAMEQLREYLYTLANDYLPYEFECTVTASYPENQDDFMEGFSDALLDNSVEWYYLDAIEFVEGDELCGTDNMTVYLKLITEDENE